MTTALLVRRFLLDYARNPVNLLVLVVVPVVFVVVAAGSLADAAKLLGGAAGGFEVETATAGWAAGFLAGVAMYFQIAGARDTDRRLVIAGLSAARLVTARLLAGLVLAALAGIVALVALAARTGIAEPGRVAAGTLMFAVIYLGIGAMVGAIVPNPVNGTVLILFIWILDVFFGPITGPVNEVVTRALPTHFVSLWMVDLPSRHGGRLGDLGWALVWVATALAAALIVVTATTRLAGHRQRRGHPGSVLDQLRAAVSAGLRDCRRNRVLWILLVVVPAVFILLADAITPHGLTRVVLVEGGQRLSELLDPADFHSGTMAPIAVASLATLTGLFVGVDSRSADQRLTLAGLRPAVVLGARLTVITLVALLATGVALAAAATVVDIRQWGVYAAANGLLAITYGLVGYLLGPIFGRVGGVFIAFLVPFLDLGIGQSPMLGAEPASWALYLPGYGGSRVLIDGALTAGFDELGALLIALTWLTALGLTAVAVFRRTTTMSPPRRVAARTVIERA